MFVCARGIWKYTILLLVHTNNRIWMIQSVERVHERGFMSKGNEYAFHAEVNQQNDILLGFDIR